MSLRFPKIQQVKQKLFIPVTQFTGMQLNSTQPTFTVQNGSIGSNMSIGLNADANTAVVVGGTGITANRTLGASSPVGTPTISARTAGVSGGSDAIMTEIGTTGFTGLVMTTAGDDVRHLMNIPTSWDRKQNIYVRMIWASEASAAGVAATSNAVTWKFLYDPIIYDSTVIAAPDDALNTVITEDLAIGTAKTIQRSPAGIINGGVILDTAEAIMFLCEADAITSFTGAIYFIGVEFEYTHRFGEGTTYRESKDYVAR